MSFFSVVELINCLCFCSMFPCWASLFCFLFPFLFFFFNLVHLFIFFFRFPGLQLPGSSRFQSEAGGVLVHAAGRPVDGQHAAQAAKVAALVHQPHAGPQTVGRPQGFGPQDGRVRAVYFVHFLLFSFFSGGRQTKKNQGASRRRKHSPSFLGSLPSSFKWKMLKRVVIPIFGFIWTPPSPVKQDKTIWVRGTQHT